MKKAVFAGGARSVQSLPCVLLPFLALAIMSTCAWAQGSRTAEWVYNRPYLTWQGDPCTTMTINWHSEEAPKKVEVRYDTEKRDGKEKQYAGKAEGKSWQIPGLPDGRFINSVELTGLAPGTVHYFVLTGPKGKFSEEFAFRTIPNDGSPIRFVTGGDQSPSPAARKLCALSGKEAPMFTLIGGDLAYANGDLKNARIWDGWLKNWMDGMVTPDGLLVPMVLAIGNHETNKLPGTPEERAPFFFGYFPQGGKVYFSRVFGPNLHVVALDSGHIEPHANQTAWLREQFEGNAGVKHHIPVYHVPFWPSHRDFEGGGSVAGREQWMPLFDEFKVPVAFENHDHTFKRTVPIRNGEKNPEGTVYLGDGCMGVGAREIKNGDAWYIEKASSTQHIWVVDVDANGVSCRAIDVEGNQFDQWKTGD